MTARTGAWLDQEDAHIAGIIRQHGWFIQYVGGDCCAACGTSSDGDDDSSPAFAYTVGLFGLGHPELVIVGVDPHTAAAVLNAVGRKVRAGDNLVCGQLVTVDVVPGQLFVENMPNPGQVLFSANRHYRRPSTVSVEAVQLIWPDDAGRFPWDEGCAIPPGLQPRAGTWRA